MEMKSKVFALGKCRTVVFDETLNNIFSINKYSIQIASGKLKSHRGFSSYPPFNIPSRSCSSNSNVRKEEKGNDIQSTTSYATKQAWSEEWSRLGLGARLPRTADDRITNLLFAQTGFGVDQHGDRGSDGATKAAVRAVRNAIEFNSIPGVIEAVPGGRSEMLIQVKLGVPAKTTTTEKKCEEGTRARGYVAEAQWMEPMDLDLSHVAKVFPYGRLLPIQVVVGGLSFPTGRIVHELGDKDDMAICVAACVSIGYDNGTRNDVERKDNSIMYHETYNTKDGF